jgi:hypothetical protein
VLPGLADAHAHPAVAGGADGIRAAGCGRGRANLIAWAKIGITLVRDVGSPGEVTPTIGSAPGLPYPQWPLAELDR